MNVGKVIFFRNFLENEIKCQECKQLRVKFQNMQASVFRQCNDLLLHMILYTCQIITDVSVELLKISLQSHCMGSQTLNIQQATVILLTIVNNIILFVKDVRAEFCSFTNQAKNIIKIQGSKKRNKNWDLKSTKFTKFTKSTKFCCL